MDNRTTTVVQTGIGGMDTILHGGLPSGSTIVLEGAPGTGKTTFAMQFLFNGATIFDEAGIYITFEELPDQIYRDMLAFNWDLRKLEHDGKLRVVCISPEVFLNQMMEPGSLLEQMMAQINCRRIVIDSISLFRMDDLPSEKQRTMLYALRNALRKHGITSFLIQEKDRDDGKEIPFANYLADGVVRLSLLPHMEKYRKRTVEVLKMRGRKIIEGEHQYKITGEGIHIVPALTMIEDKLHTDKSSETVPTGLQLLDDALGGGIPNGSAFLLDTNSKANYKYMTTSIFMNQFKANKKVISLSSSTSSITDTGLMFKMFDVSLDDLIKQQRIFFIEHYNRPYPPEYESAVIDVSELDNQEYRLALKEKLAPITQDSLSRGEQWFIYYDLNTIFSQRGADFVTRFYAEEVAKARSYGFTVLAFCNFAEIHPEVASYLERASSGVIRTWVDNNYQFLQLTKSPMGNITEPLIVENTKMKPFVSLI